MEGRRSGYEGCLFVVILGLLAYGVLGRVFSESREAAIESRRFDDGQRLARATAAYVRKHGGKLPGVGWTDRLETVDAGITRDLWREQDGKRLGFAAIPGVLDRSLSDLPPETILFVESRAGRSDSIVHDLGEVGGRLRKGTAVTVTAENVTRDAPTLMTPLIRIGMQLARQHAPNLK